MGALVVIMRAPYDSCSSPTSSGRWSPRSSSLSRGWRQEVVPDRMIAVFSKEYCGSSEQERSGDICRRSTRRTRRATADFRHGWRAVLLTASRRSSPWTWSIEERSNSRVASSTPPSQGQKRGPCSGAHEAWERLEDHGNRGRKLSSSRHPCGQCFSGRGHPG